MVTQDSASTSMDAQDELKYRKALSRFYAGITSTPDHENDHILVTLTTPQEFKGDLNHAWRLFRLKSKRNSINFPYFGVREYNEKRTCEHLHMVLRARFIDVSLLRRLWTEVCNVHIESEIENAWIHIDKISGGSKGLARYLAKYLFKRIENGRGLRKYWYSQDWIYHGYAKNSKELYLANFEHLFSFSQLREMDKSTRYRYFIGQYHYILCYWYDKFCKDYLTSNIKFDILIRIKSIIKEIDRLSDVLRRYEHG